MGWSMLKERGGESSRLMHLVKEAKESLEEICELVEEMDGSEYGERESYGSRGGSYGMRRDDTMGMRRAYRVVQDDDDEWGERRRRDSRGRYM